MLCVLRLGLCLRCRRHGQEGYAAGFLEVGFWIGFGGAWTRRLVQTLLKTYLGGTRGKFQMVFEQVVWSKLTQILSKTLSQNPVEHPTCPKHGGIVVLGRLM